MFSFSLLLFPIPTSGVVSLVCALGLKWGIRVQLGQGEAAVELLHSRVCVTSYFVPSGSTEARTEAVGDAAASNEQGTPLSRSLLPPSCHTWLPSASVYYYFRRKHKISLSAQGWGLSFILGWYEGDSSGGGGGHRRALYSSHCRQ